MFTVKSVIVGSSCSQKMFPSSMISGVTLSNTMKSTDAINVTSALHMEFIGINEIIDIVVVPILVKKLSGILKSELPPMKVTVIEF